MRRSIATCFALALTAASPAVLAIGMGKMTVLSPLGETLNAEIELQDLGLLDISSVKASVAPLAAFKQSNIEPSPVLRTVQLHVEQKSGKAIIKLNSAVPINAPFLDMLVELQWPAGRLVREYTLLLDPPGYVKSDDVAPVKLPMLADRVSVEAPPEPVAQTADVPAKPVIAPSKEAGAVAKMAPAPKPGTIKVKPGDTLYGLASQVKTDDVSLEEMLVALYQANKQAFAGSNMNRLVAGKILTVPPSSSVATIGQTAASHEIRAHVAEWDAYRQKLAAAATDGKTGRESSAQKTVSGKITTSTEDAAPAAAKDVLKLSKNAASKGGVGLGLQEKIQALQEDAVAHEKTIKEANARISELEKSIKDMQRLLDIKNQNLAALAQKPAAQSLEPAKPKREEPALLDVLTGTPAYLGGVAAAALLLIAGLLVARKKMRAKRTGKAAGGTGTGGIDAAGGLSTGGVVSTDTSFLTDFSRAGLGTIDTNEVDPIAEADVYLAYGRDGQAEDILKEARAKEPQRYEIHQKLLEIYAARKSVKEFEAIAGELYPALEGQNSPIWNKVARMGHEIDPANPLYGPPGDGAAAEATPNHDLEKTLILSAETAAAMRSAGPPPPLDFDLGETEPEASEDLAPELDVDLSDLAEGEPGESAAEELTAEEGVIDFNIEEPSEEPGMAASAAPASDEPALDFDLGEAAVAPEPAEEVAEPAPTDTDLDDLLEMAELDVEEGEPDSLLPGEAQAGPDVATDIEILPEAPGEMPDAAAETAGEMAEVEEAAEVAENEVADNELADIEELSLSDFVEPVMGETIQASAEEAPLEEEAKSLPGTADELGLSEAMPPAAEETALNQAAALPGETPEIEEEASPEMTGGVSAEAPPDVPLDFDFDIEVPRQEAAVEVESPMAVPDLDLSGLSLDLDETPAPAAGETEIEVPASQGDAQWQESATKLDLARAYMEMGDREGAREILLEVAREGNAKQQEEANTLLTELGE